MTSRGRIALAAGLLAVMACSDSGVGPILSRDDRLTALPLALGSEWDYALTFDVTFEDVDGAPVLPPEHRQGTGTRIIVALDTIAGREYAVEDFTARADGGAERTRWRRFRQEDGVVYQADVPLLVPPGGVPGDADPGELVRLRLPPDVGDSWRLRAGDPGVTVTVESLDTLTVGTDDVPAWRVRIVDDSAGPADYTADWYGADGLIRRVVHEEFDAVDVGSGERVHITKHEIQELVEYRPAPEAP